MKKKITFLFLALLLPVVVFVFLKTFGRNEFRVPVMHQEGRIVAAKNCPFEYAIPYTVPDSVFTSQHLNRNDSLYVFYFDPEVSTAMHRITVEFGEAPVQLVALVTDTTRLQVLTECVLLMEPGTSVALVDHRNRIRGYYDGYDRDEVDRLMVEIKIILKRY